MMEHPKFVKRKQAHRRFLVAVFGYCVLAYVFYRLHRDGDGLVTDSQENWRTRIDTTACRIWPDSNVTDYANLRYDAYDAKQSLLPLVGDAGVIGDANSCLKADSRFDQYRASSVDGHSWDEVQWGKSLTHKHWAFPPFFYVRNGC